MTQSQLVFPQLTQAQFTSGLCTENAWLLTSAFDNVLLSLSTRCQKKEKDAKLSLHGTHCDIRSFFFSWLLFSSSGTPPLVLDAHL